MGENQYTKKRKLLAKQEAEKSKTEKPSAAPAAGAGQSEDERAQQRTEVKAAYDAEKSGDTGKTKRVQTAKILQAKLDNMQSAKDDAEGFAIIMVSVLGIVVERMPKPKPLTETEKNLVGSTFTKVAVKYFGSLKWKEEIAFFAALGVTVLPRMNLTREDKEKAKQTEGANGTTA